MRTSFIDCEYRLHEQLLAYVAPRRSIAPKTCASNNFTLSSDECTPLVTFLDGAARAAGTLYTFRMRAMSWQAESALSVKGVKCPLILAERCSVTLSSVT
jgi:hypothetical protein